MLYLKEREKSSFGAQDSETIRSDSETKSNCGSGDVLHYPEGALVGCGDKAV